MLNFCFFVVFLLVKATHGEQLNGVVVIFRHGDRTPVLPYPNDPYKNRSYWPVGFGQLINAGKLRHLELGRWLRQRYANYLPDIYSEDDITVRSTDVDRTLMSAEANLAGLYPPVARQQFLSNLSWQPIPVHSRPEKDDPMLAMKKQCPKYDQLFKQMMKGDYFRRIERKNHDLYAYLTLKSGSKVTSLETLEYLYNTLLIETLFNYTLPDWAQKAMPKMQQWAFLSFATACYNQDLARLKTGPLLQHIVEYFRNRSDSNPSTKKLLMFSAHDTTIANMLNSLGAFQLHAPPYASTILMELTARNTVQIYYKNSTQPQNITLQGCQFDCPLDLFQQLLKPLTLTLDEWAKECQLSLLDVWPLDLTGNVILVSLSGCLMLGLAAIFMTMRMGNKKQDGAYIQLPNEEQYA